MSEVEGQVHAMAVEIALHQRLDPMTSRDRCTCGYRAELGKLFTRHIAEAISYIPGVLSAGGRRK